MRRIDLRTGRIDVQAIHIDLRTGRIDLRTTIQSVITGRVEPTLMADQVYGVLRDAIMSGELPGGARLRVRDVAAQVALDGEVALDEVAQLDDLVLGQVPDERVRVDAGLGEQLVRGRAADPVHVRETDLSALAVSYTPLRPHETVLDLLCRLLLEKKKRQ